MAITKDESNWPIISLSLGENFDQETVEELPLIGKNCSPVNPPLV